MKKFTAAIALVAFAALAPISAQAADGSVKAGKTLYGQNGKRIGAIYRVKDDGTVQVIVNGKMVSYPASTVSIAEGKVVTSAGKPQMASNR